MRFGSLPNRPSALKAGGFLLLAAITCVFFIDLCGLYFQCGCRSLWAGAASQCNIHHSGVKHCPLCLLPLEAFLAYIALILLAQGYLIWRDKWLWAVLAFPLLTALEALVLGWYRGYWE